MIDCPNAEMRDYLPDLLHGRLDAATAARVAAHVAACADCTAELEVLRGLRAVMGRAPAIDLARLASAIPAHVPIQRRWAGWRAAAAVVLLVGGGASLLLVRDAQRQVADSARVVAVTRRVPTPAENDTFSRAPVTSRPQRPVEVATHKVVDSVRAPLRVAEATPARELALAGGSMSDLNDRQLAALLKAIDELDAVPSTDVETTSLAPAPRRAVP